MIEDIKTDKCLYFCSENQNLHKMLTHTVTHNVPIKRGIILMMLPLVMSSAQAGTPNSLTVVSPDGHLRVELGLDQSQAVFRVKRDTTSIINDSRLGFADRTAFAGGIISSKKSSINETYHLPHGKVSTYVNRCNAIQTSYDDGTGKTMTVEFRVYDDAVAFRYILPRNEGAATFSSEETTVNFATFNSGLAMNFTNDYSTYYNSHAWADLTNNGGYSEPMLIDMGDKGYCLLTEANQDERTTSCRIMKGDSDGQLRLQLYAPTTITSYPFASPWRTLILGDIHTIVESYAVDNLAEDSKVSDTSWIEAGCAAWNWGGQDMDGTASESVWRRYVDLAAHLGWRYCLIDDGWKNDMDVPAFVSYCREKNVQPILWLNQGDFSTDYNNIHNTMRQYVQQGIKGLKIDFFDGDSQDMMRKYVNMLKASAQLKMVLDLHGCTRPTGWERTYPQLLTMEAAYGGEMNLDWHHLIPASHQANLVVTRNVIGSMDFTPGKIAMKDGRIFTYNTWLNDMATMVLFESGLQCLTDCPENIVYSVVEPLYRQLPAAWDGIKCLEAAPGRYATIARRKGGNWYVAGVTSSSRMAQVDLSFLSPDSTYYAYIYSEGDCRYNVDFELRGGVRSTDKLSIAEGQNGGFVVVLSTQDTLPKPKWTTYEAENYTLVGGTKKQATDCSAGAYLTGLGNKTRAAITRVNAEADGEYAITLYYKLGSSNSAYLQVGNNGDKNYYAFETHTDKDNSHGYTWAMKTVYVTLQKGRNILYYGNDNGAAPDLDKILVTPTMQTQQAITSINLPSATTANLNNDVLQKSGKSVMTHLLQPGHLHVYSLAGHLLHTTTVPAGSATTRLPVDGTVIVSIDCGRQGYARKMTF